jgi:hypothetical protein
MINQDTTQVSMADDDAMLKLVPAILDETTTAFAVAQSCSVRKISLFAATADVETVQVPVDNVQRPIVGAAFDSSIPSAPILAIVPPSTLIVPPPEPLPSLKLNRPPKSVTYDVGAYRAMGTGLADWENKRM